MKTLTRTAAAAMLLTLPMTLAACGGGTKPSKAEAASGYAKIMKAELGSEAAGLSDADMNKYTTCVVDKSYNKLSARTLNAMKSGKKDAKGDKKDEATLKTATQDATCVKILTDAVAAKSGS